MVSLGKNVTVELVDSDGRRYDLGGQVMEFRHSINLNGQGTYDLMIQGRDGSLTIGPGEDSLEFDSPRWRKKKPVVECKHCGQWAAMYTACKHCGAPVP